MFSASLVSNTDAGQFPFIPWCWKPWSDARLNLCPQWESFLEKDTVPDNIRLDPWLNYCSTCSLALWCGSSSHLDLCVRRIKCSHPALRGLICISEEKWNSFAYFYYFSEISSSHSMSSGPHCLGTFQSAVHFLSCSSTRAFLLLALWDTLTPPSLSYEYTLCSLV